MKLEFEIETAETTEFGVGRDAEGGPKYLYLPVDGEVQKALREMATATWDAMQALTTNPSRYQPSEKHGGTEYLYLPLDDDLASSMRQLHQANNLPTDSKALSSPVDVFCYFVRLTDSNGRRLTGLRRATQFKGMLKHRLLRFDTDALMLIHDKVFKLDNDFDLLVDSASVHILRPSGFEFAGRLQEAVLAAVAGNVQKIQKDLKFIDFSGVEEYARKHPRAARYLASIRAEEETKDIDKGALTRFCKVNQVQIKTVDGKLTVAADQIMDFLEVLDRRRYEVKLTKGSSEKFRATGRQKIG